ncbi:oxidoreductase [Spongiactinospora gelatinilytica]|uniref:Oxidoreductase n=1 Tax=Spongiactinospora gelatinilytica TaxID=2666298 RepID=A0A2W2GWS4_9ACTN|nr:SDR family NAD(P)-dependent oxidoreductase [Spongiactinospora gelatinilytica]PZG46989.1 oxidoreductase [Spongiactinospora gelatinilytica]
MRLPGTTALITGSTGGIGRAIARRLAGQGVKVVLSGRRADLLTRLATELDARAIPADLSKPDGPRELLSQAGPVDILVANAAVMPAAHAADLAVDDIDGCLNVNLRAPIVMACAAAEQMMAAKRGHLVFMNSMCGKTAQCCSSLYNATKFGLRGFTQALSADLRPHGIGVSAIHPGFVRDEGMFARSGVPLPPGVGSVTPEDVARAVQRAIRTNALEINVAPAMFRFGATLAGVSPRLWARWQRASGAERLSQALAASARNRGSALL